MQPTWSRFQRLGPRAWFVLAVGAAFAAGGVRSAEAAPEPSEMFFEEAGDEGAAFQAAVARLERAAAREALGGVGAAAATAARLGPERKGQLGGVLPLDTPTTVVTPVVSDLTFLTDADQLYRIEVPPSAGRLQVDLVMDDPQTAVGMVLRHGAAPMPEGANPQVDAFALSPFGWQSAAIGKESGAAQLQPGTYFLALVVISPGRSGTGVLRATIRPETFAGVELRDDQPVGYLRTPRPSPVLFGGDFAFVVDVPAEATELRIRSSFNDDVDVDLHVRRGQSPGLAGGSVIDDHRATRRVRGGSEEIVITSASSPPLTPGLYFISTGVLTRNEAAIGLMLADLTCPGGCAGSSGGGGNSGGGGGNSGGGGGGGGGVDLGTPATVSAASFMSGEAAIDSMVTSFAEGMTTGGSQVADALPLPIILAGTTIQVFDASGREGFAELFFGGSGQANWRVPDWASQGPARVIFRREDGQQRETMLELTDVQPGLFSADATGQGPPAAVALYIDANGNQTTGAAAECDGSGCRPLPIDLSDRSRQVILLAFGTGFRRAGGFAASIGGVEVPVLGFGPQGQFVSLDQANIALDGERIPDGRQPFSITADGKTSNVLMLEITGGVPPPPPPPPMLTSLSSTSIQQGQTIANLSLAGSHLGPVAEVRISPPDGLTAGNLRATDSAVRIDLTASASAAPGERMVTVVSPGGESNALSLIVEERRGSPPEITGLSSDVFVITRFNAEGVSARSVLWGLRFRDADGDFLWKGEPETSAAVETQLSDGACTFRHSGDWLGEQSRTSGEILMDLEFPPTVRREDSTWLVTLIDAAGNRSSTVSASGLPYACP